MSIGEGGSLEHFPFRWGSRLSLDELIRFAKFASGGSQSEFSVTRESLEAEPVTEYSILTLEELKDACQKISLNKPSEGASAHALVREIHRRELIRETLIERDLDYEKLYSSHLLTYEKAGDLNDYLLQSDGLSSRLRYESLIEAGLEENIQLIVRFIENKKEIELMEDAGQLAQLAAIYSVFMYYLELFPEYEA